MVLESPWAGLDCGPKAQHYLRQCIRDSIARGEIPWASHVMFAWTQALYEEDPEQRHEGIKLCKDMIRLHAQKVVFYVDHGMSPGMRAALTWARMHGKPVDTRRLYGDSASDVGLVTGTPKAGATTS